MDNLDREIDNQDPKETKDGILYKCRLWSTTKEYMSGLFKMLKDKRGFAGDPPAGDPPAGDPPAGDPPSGDPPGAATLTPDKWREHIHVDRREHPSMTNFKTIDDLANGYLNAQKMVGVEKIPIPPKDATFDSAEMQTVFDKMGRPSDPKNYTIPDVQIPEGAPKASDEQVDAFKKLAHSIGLMPAQVEALYKFNQEGVNNIHTQSTQTQTEEFQKTETALRGKLGKSYDSMMARAQQVITKFGGEEVSKIIGASGVGRNPLFIEFMMNVAKNFGEDGELLGDANVGDIMSPEEAQKEIKKIKGDKDHPWHKRDHTEHEDALKQMTSLFQMAYPDKK